jgi:hypothetical protein
MKFVVFFWKTEIGYSPSESIGNLKKYRRQDFLGERKMMIVDLRSSKPWPHAWREADISRLWAPFP